MTGCVAALDRRFYPGVADHWDDELFRGAIGNHLDGSSVVLDVGAGAGIVPHMNFRGKARRVCGIDLDPRVLDNPHLDEAHVASAEQIPFADATFDVVFSDNVLEHLEAPDRVFGEIARVLKPGGAFLFKTPNRHHYMPLVASLTPHGFHRYINRLRGRASVDTFPTRYRANSRRRVHELAAAAGLTVSQLELVEGRPEYTRMFCLLYLCGILYERTVNRFAWLAGLRILLIGKLTKAPVWPDR